LVLHLNIPKRKVTLFQLLFDVFDNFDSCERWKTLVENISWLSWDQKGKWHIMNKNLLCLFIEWMHPNTSSICKVVQKVSKIEKQIWKSKCNDCICFDSKGNKSQINELVSFELQPEPKSRLCAAIRVGQRFQRCVQEFKQLGENYKPICSRLQSSQRNSCLSVVDDCILIFAFALDWNVIRLFVVEFDIIRTNKNNTHKQVSNDLASSDWFLNVSTGAMKNTYVGGSTSTTVVNWYPPRGGCGLAAVVDVHI
jgi:hypothetical protein